MANWFAVWRTADGHLESVGTSVADPLPVGLSKTDLGVDASQPAPIAGKVWNESTHAFVDSGLRSVLSLKGFWDRFTATEREALVNLQLTGTATQKNKLDAFKDYVRDCGFVDCNDAYIQASVNLCESANIIAAGRAAQILA